MLSMPSQEAFDDAVRQSIFDLDASNAVDPLCTGVVAIGAFTAAIHTFMELTVAAGAEAAGLGADPDKAAEKVAFIVALLGEVNNLAAEGAHRYLHGDD